MYVCVDYMISKKEIRGFKGQTRLRVIINLTAGSDGEQSVEEED